MSLHYLCDQPHFQIVLPIFPTDHLLWPKTLPCIISPRYPQPYIQARNDKNQLPCAASILDLRGADPFHFQRAIVRSASISPPRRQAVEANRCKARSASLETNYDHRTPSIYTCYSPCLHLHLKTTIYWWMKLIYQVLCMQQTARPNSSWV